MAAETVEKSATWLDHGVPYVIDGDTYVDGTATPALTIEAGAVVKFDGGYGLYIGYSAPGRLVAVGTAAEPSSSRPTPARRTPGTGRAL